MRLDELKIIDFLSDAIILIDLNKKIVRLNRKAEELTGYSATSAVGKPCYEVIGIDLCEDGCPVDNVISDEQCIKNFDVTLKNREGQLIPICLNTTPIEDSSGKVIGIIDNLRVISHVKTIINDIDDERLRNKAILDSIDDGVYTIDKEWRITSFNKTAERITGFSASEVIGKVCSDVLKTPLCKKRCPLKRLLTQKKTLFNISSNFIRKNGEEISVILNMALFIDRFQNVLGGVTTFRDLSTMEAHVVSHKKKMPVHGIVGKSSAILKVLDLANTAARSDINVFISGDSGTGKNLIAQAIHYASERKNGPFVKVNMSAIPETLMESELYGHVKGAFTGADRDSKGKFEIAEGGTLFLDEVTEMSVYAQAKILQVIQDKQFYPVGGNTLKTANVRIICATNRNMHDEIQSKRFRDDLFFRLNVFPIVVPPIRERVSDLPLIIHHILEKLSILYGGESPTISAGLLEKLRQYSWPGNIRELENVLEYGFLCSEGSTITEKNVELVLGTGQKIIGDAVESNDISHESNDERQRVLRILTEVGWNRQEASKVLGVDRTTLWRKMKKYQIS